MFEKRLLKNILSIGLVLLIIFIILYFKIPIGFTVFENIGLNSLFLFLILIIIIIIIVVIILMIFHKIKEKKGKNDAKK